ncbi:glycosyltransferase family 39 protein [Hymenobacter latericus]|uniref:glycosyltransferase family 39 protein n=1 Tax=Hymenobacter sp. YIM 151858-1 TaxID=2987688 RepID=UPI002226F95B|nr:glycosyltransferase family 39 protein [Hymenobacter sp. YIM 151858-1]UYZ60027.1 glycosyltransferase family 39 protein [Hymenobacter sp. YIM 151858-1]
MKSDFFARKYYLGGVVLLLALFAATLYHRIARFDDAWCTEQSYWLLKEGIVRSELFRGYNFWHERLYVFHKAFVYIQAPVLYVLGCHIWAARTIPILFSVVGLVLLLRYFRRQPEQQWLVALLYVGCGCLWLYGVDNRPETMTVASGLASFALLRRASVSAKNAAAAGMLAGLAGLTHLNGVIYLAAGGLWLLVQRRWSHAVLFGLVGGATLGLYLADALWDNQLDRLLFQFRNDHAASSNFNWAAKLRVMSKFDRIFFHSDGELPLTVFFLVVIGVLLARPATRRAILTPSMQYLLLLVGIFWLLTKGTSTYYYLLFAPFLMLVAVEELFSARPALLRWQRNAIMVAIALYPLGGVARTLYLVQLNRSEPYIMAENARLAALMPQRGAKVIAPLDFFFGQMPNYSIRSLTYYQLIAPGNPPPVAEFFAQAARDSVHYIICDHRQWNQIYHVPPSTPARMGPYKRVYQTQWRSLYVHQ